MRIARPNWFAEQWRSRPERVWLLLILLLALSLRVIRLGAWPYWHDEAYSLILTEDLHRTLTGDLVSNHPPLFTILLYVWKNLGLAQNEWSARLLVAVLGVCSAWAIYLVTRRLLDTRTALLAAFLIAISPIHVVHSQDLKEYMVLPVTAPVMIYFLYRATEENTRLLWFLYGLWAGIACYSDLFVGPLLVAINLWYVLRTRFGGGTFVRWLLANVFGAALFLPQLGIMLHKAQDILIGTKDWWVPKPTLLSVAFYVKALAFGYSDLDPHFKIALGFYVALAALGTFVAARRNRWVAALLLMWFVIPVAIVFTFSQFTQSAFLIRAMLPYGLALYVLAAAGLAGLRSMPLRTLALIGLAVIAAFPLAQRYTDRYALREFPHRPGVHPPLPYRDATRFIVNRWQEGDIVTHGSGSGWLSTFWYGLRGRPTYQISPNAFYSSFVNESHPDITADETFLAYLPRNPQELLDGKRRVWYVFTDWEREYLPGNATEAWRWLDSHYTELLHRRFDGLEVFLYGDAADTRAVARLSDDGVAAEMTYETDTRQSRYRKIRPDNGLVALSPSERRGALELRFTEGSGGPVRDLSGGRPAGEVSFGVSNRTAAPVPCRVECVASDYMLDAASLLETNPGSDVWRVGPMYNVKDPAAPYEIPVLSGELTEDSGDSLLGRVALQPGRYDVTLLLLGWPGDAASLRAPMQFRFGDQDVLAAPGRPSEDWLWWVGLPLAGPPSAATLPITVTAQPIPGKPQSWVNLGYVALRRAENEERMRLPGAALPSWPGEVSIPAGGALTWTVRTDAARVDVWVYERGDTGRAYRIFRPVAGRP